MYRYKKIKLRDGSTIDEHRLIMQRHLKRKLNFNECIHHKDGNKRNNILTNLELVDRSEHAKLHFKNGDLKIGKGECTLSENKKHELRLKYTKLTEEQAKYVLNSNKKSKDLASELNVSRFVISRIRTKKTWKNLHNK